ncbi:putative Ig domain-containing protein, partial [Aquiluna sp.]|nr:putative Ig domain-containing protein [Aquiluna sp.]
MTTTETVAGVSYTIAAFKTVGTCSWTVPTGVTSGDVLVVGGGGGGSGNYTGDLGSSGGSGGAGGVLPVTNLALPSTVSITVGQGGSGGAPRATRSGAVGSQGGDSFFGAISAGGGGAGGCDANATNGTACGSSSQIHGRPGTASGSGGSPSNFYNAYNFGSAGAASSAVFNGQTISAVPGFRGGYYNDGGSSVSYTSGSGGGAASAGNRSSPGAGISSSITGTSVSYGIGGSSYDSANYLVAPEANTGSGGNGAYNPSAASNGMAGSDGIVVVRYATPVPATVQNFSAATRLVDADSATDSVTLSWDALTGQTPAVTSYEIEYSTASNYASSTTQTVAVTNSAAATPNTATISGLTDGATYYFRIKARNTAGDSASYAETSSIAVSASDSATSFNGTTSFASVAGNVIPATGDYTAEAWINPDAIDVNWRTILSQGDQTGRFFLGLILSSGKYYIVVSRNAEFAFADDAAEVGDISGQWTHVAATVNDSNDSVNVYVNGALVLTTTSALATTNSGFTIGDYLGSYKFDGQIDQVKIWNDVRTKSEIEASMHAWGNPVISDTSLISHYDFNDDTQATTLRDQAGSNDLTYTSVATSDLKPLVERDTSSRSGYAVYEFKRSYLTAAGGWTAPAGVSTTQYLVVGGGGAGGSTNYGAAGGGGGGRVLDNNLDLTGVSSVKVTVGQGGIPIAAAESAVTPDTGSDGQSSILVPAGGSEISALGGGGGANARLYSLGQPAPSTTGWTGGGGSAHGSSSSSSGSQGIGGSSFEGGDGNPSGTGSYQSGGGGGGAGGLGTDATDGQGGTGGAGVSSDIQGGALLLGGGGGGGVRYDSGSPGGGQAGGGSGGDGGDGLSGTANTGGGGGGAGEQSRPNPGGSGGSGVVILAYATGTVSATNPSDVTVDRARTATFTTTATATGTVSYQWQLSTDSGATWSDIDGATSASYTTGTLAYSENGNQYRAVVSAVLNGGAATDTTSAATLTVTNTGACSPTEDKTSDPGYTILKFTNENPCVWTNDTGKTTFDVAVVGGGGGGGFGNRGGGGGAGEVIVTSSSLTIDASAERYISIGAGGTSGAGDSRSIASSSGTWTFGGDGSASAFDSFSAYGGGGGGGGTAPNNRSAGAEGGSGGGSDHSNSLSVAALAHSHTGWTSYANAGGGGAGQGGGGGGAGTAGNVLEAGESSQGRGGYFVEVWGVKLAGGGGGWRDGLGAEGTTEATFLGGNARGQSPYAYVGNSQGVANTGTGGGARAPGGSGIVMIRFATPLAITTPTSGLSATFGQAISAITIATSGGSGTNVFSVSSGTLPAGLSLNTSTGVISGTPTAAGDQAIEITVTDSSSATATTSSFTISVAAETLSAGTTTLSATTDTLKSINASWSGVSNASSYT